MSSLMKYDNLVIFLKGARAVLRVSANSKDNILSSTLIAHKLNSVAVWE